MTRLEVFYESDDENDLPVVAVPSANFTVVAAAKRQPRPNPTQVTYQAVQTEKIYWNQDMYHVGF
jgi:hypothetical protein